MLQILFVLLPAQGSCFQVASSMFFPCLRFEPSYISWPSHTPTGEKKKYKEVAQLKDMSGGLCCSFPLSLYCFHFLGD